MKNRFDEQVDILNAQMIEMGAMIETTIENACDALQTANLPKAREIMEADSIVDRKEREIESLCLRMLLTRQPVAHNLRVVSSALKMITDMERIGDHAADISEIVTFMDYSAAMQPEHFGAMSRAAIEMVHRAIDAYVRQDVQLARAVIASDDTVDELFVDVKRELIELLKADSSRGSEALDLLMIAKYFERIGDHATNIAEWVEYSVTGIYKGEVLQ
ncbi:MAG TPA: phosphate signaling complex protein PhoU [Candidatus Limiplasma sp.]|nr:phosphate signaling complex protein PhoU [Candidatus Limiplasma sp.]